MSHYLKMADAVKAQAVEFLDAQGVPHDAEIPELSEERTQGDLVAAPMPEDRVTAALLILRTHTALGVCKMQELINSPEDNKHLADRIADLMYRLRMYQDAMHSETLRERWRDHHRRKDRKKGAEREGSAAWIAERLTRNGKNLETQLRRIAETGDPVELGGMAVQLKYPTGRPATGGRYSQECYLHFGKYKPVTVKTLRKKYRELRKPA